ncbi:hypothetical protein VD0002_g7810 [Verticillium dahliae]|uniref:Uncharacterized protein n=1 Tax=Verticillium dahliae TaxID=27337 RepID=A0AA44WQ60_VERDA|nr:hypothetical protein BJF96_g1465 [Verticillium dahliae]PNH44682.1 hypothetical protein VD0004_g3078 [Verticillium dahliae]PNH56241.1 hypothetical protein VD0003_g1500 [Verticillium dahliae]PNH59751.1 hypothetical protein VD0002_g7810 [Verticillium dahliae]PNH74520.1 hypothetical protein VD0001_g3071 [Verticillium dahliae]
MMLHPKRLLLPCMPPAIAAISLTESNTHASS